MQPGTPRLAGKAVWAVFCVCLLSSLSFVVKFGPNLPAADEWVLVPHIAGQEPVTIRWLWSQHNEHRLVLTRTLLVPLVRTTRDFRSGMFLLVSLLAVITALLMFCSRRARGAPSWTDMVFPLLWLTPRPGLLHPFLIQLVLHSLGLSLVLAGSFVESRAARWACRSAGCAVLALCGAHGMVVNLVIALWLADELRLLRGRRLKGEAGGPVMLIVGIVAFTCAYWVDYVRPVQHPLAAPFGDRVAVTLQFLSAGLGGGWSWAWPVAGALLVGMTLAALPALLSLRISSSAAEQRRGGAVGVLILSTLVLAASTGAVRAGLGSGTGLDPKYQLVSAMLGSALVITFVLARREARARFLTLLALFGAIGGTGPAIAEGEGRRSLAVRIVQEARCGTSRLTVDAARHFSALHIAASNVELLRRHQLGPWPAEAGDCAGTSPGQLHCLSLATEAASLHADSWHPREPDGRWSRPRATLRLEGEPPKGPLGLRFSGINHEEHPIEFQVVVHGRLVARPRVTPGPFTIVAMVPHEEAHVPLTVELVRDPPFVPAAEGINDDRVLGVFLTEVCTSSP